MQDENKKEGEVFISRITGEEVDEREFERDEARRLGHYN